MKSIAELRRDRVRWLIDTYHRGSRRAFEKRMGYETKGYASRLISKTTSNWKKLGDSGARAIEKAHGIEKYMLDMPLETKATGIAMADGRDPLVAHLVKLFVNLSADSQDELLAKANRLFVKENPGTSIANPYGEIKPEPAHAPKRSRVRA